MSTARVAVSRRPVLWGFVTMLVLLCIVYAFSVDIRASRGAAITGDEPFYLLTTQSLLRDGDLDLRNQYEARSYRVFFDHPDGLWRQSVPTGDGRLLSPHNPGLSVLVIPGYALARLPGVQTQLLLMASMTFGLTYVLIGYVTRRHLLSWVATLAVALTASAFVYSTEVYPEMPAALTLVVSLLLVSGNCKGTWRAVAMTGVLTAMAWLGVKYVPLGALVALYFLWRSDTSGRIALLGLGCTSGLLYLWFHLITFGGATPYSVNIAFAQDSTMEMADRHFDVLDRAYRLYGLFIDERFGLGRWSPVLLAAVPSAVLLVKARGIPRLVLGLVAVQMAIATFIAITMMGWWFPGRTLMTILPLLALPLALLMSRLSPVLRGLVGALLAYSALATLDLARAGYSGEVTVAVDPFDMRSAVFQAAAFLFANYASWTLETYLLSGVWIAAAIASWVVVWRRESDSPEAIAHPYGMTMGLDRAPTKWGNVFR